LLEHTPSQESEAGVDPLQASSTWQ
jgi:hypothetical protein